MTSVVRAAITQTTWTGDKESMLDKHEQFARDAKAQGAQIICFQELFYGPYFGITEDKKYYRFAEPADGPIVQRFAALAKELEMVMILPIYEEEMTGVYYNTAVVVDADAPGVTDRASRAFFGAMAVRSSWTWTEVKACGRATARNPVCGYTRRISDSTRSTNEKNFPVLQATRWTRRRSRCVRVANIVTRTDSRWRSGVAQGAQ